MTRLWKTVACSALLLGIAGAIAYPALAHCGKCAADGKKIAAQLDQSKSTLAKAVTAAETHSKGRAISVISELNDKGQAAVHVFCIAGEPAKIMKCHFDYATGTVKGMKEVTEFPTAAHADHAHADDAAGAAGVKMIKAQTHELACGACIYKMAGVGGCPLAIMIDGTPYLVEGATWPNHDYCDRKCQGVVSGKLQGGKFLASSLEAKK